MRDNIPGYLITGLLILIIVVAFGLVGYNLYGHLTQRETLTFEVSYKDHYTTITQSCAMINEIRTCSPITNHHFEIHGGGQVFSVNRGLFNQITVGQKYAFLVTGWKGNQHIARIVEGGK